MPCASYGISTIPYIHLLHTPWLPPFSLLVHQSNSYFSSNWQRVDKMNVRKSPIASWRHYYRWRNESVTNRVQPFCLFRTYIGWVTVIWIVYDTIYIVLVCRLRHYATSFSDVIGTIVTYRGDRSQRTGYRNLYRHPTEEVESGRSARDKVKKWGTACAFVRLFASRHSTTTCIFIKIRSVQTKLQVSTSTRVSANWTPVESWTKWVAIISF